MKRIKALLFFCILLYSAQCRSAGRGASVLFTYFDDTIQQAIHSSSKLDFIENIHSIYKSWHKWYTACLVTSLQEWTKIKVASRLPNMCGNFGYMKTHPVSLVWVIKKLHRSVGILLNITHMDLPFGGDGCQFGNITINGNIYCGRKSHWVVCMDGDVTVRLQQGTTLLPGMGFVAMYSAMDGKCRVMPDTVHRLLEVNSTWWSNYTQMIYNYHKQDIASQYIWHIVVMYNKLIEFNVDSDQDCKVYDGPGPLSPVLCNSSRSSAYHLYIATQKPNIVLKYASVERTLFSTDKSVLYSSVLGKNTVYAYEVRGGTFGVRISFLSIHSYSIVSDFPMRCSFGGLFLYSYKNNNTFKIPICDTDWKEEVFLHLTDELLYGKTGHYHVLLVLYDGYTRGSVSLSVEAVEPCYIIYANAVHMLGCQFLFKLSPSDQLTFSYNFTSVGPVDLKVHVVPVIYHLYNTRVNVSVVDSSIFGLNNTIHTDIVGPHKTFHYQNPSLFIVKEILGHQFRTWRIAILRFKRTAVCDHKHINQIYHYLKGTQKVTMQPFHSGCQCVVDGHRQYLVDIIVPGSNINIALRFRDHCEVECYQGNITVREYNRQYDRLIEHTFKSFPVVLDNIHSINSIQINMTVTDNCTTCPLWIASFPGWQLTWFEAAKLSSSMRISKAFLPVEYPRR